MLIHDLGRQHVGKMAGVYFASAKLGQKTLHALAHAGREVGVLERLDEEVGHVDDGVGKDASSTRSACKVCGLEWGEWSGGVGREYGLSWKRRAIGHNVREFIFIVLAPVAIPVD